MRRASSSASSASLAPLKPSPGHLYRCQPHTIQIIQLVEATPPPRPIAAAIHSASASASASSSSAATTSASSAACPSTADSEEDCSSYCSSIVTPDESSASREPIPWTDDTYTTRMKRVHAWRDGFVNATGSTEARTSPLKRKSNPHQTDDDTVSHTSKRSRSRDGHSISRLTGYPCPACDALFPSPSSLRKHGDAQNMSEACRVAVEYNFE